MYSAWDFLELILCLQVAVCHQFGELTAVMFSNIVPSYSLSFFFCNSKWVYMCVYIYVYIYTYTHIRVYICVYIYTHTHTHTHTHTYDPLIASHVSQNFLHIFLVSLSCILKFLITSANHFTLLLQLFYFATKLILFVAEAFKFLS